MTTLTVTATDLTDHAPAPATGKPATEKQLDFARDLWKDIHRWGMGCAAHEAAEYGPDDVQAVLDLLTDRVRNATPDRTRFSALITSMIEYRDAYRDQYRDLPKAAPEQAAGPSVDVPAGRYALRVDDVVKFYVVDRPEEGKWAGYTFVSVMASDEKHAIRNREAREAILSEIAKDPQTATILYGTELGVCGRCGRTLTDEDSRAAGIGPVCAEKGW